MEDEDYRALIDLVAEELRRSGVPDIAHERHYVYTDPETGEATLFEPQKRLTLMLEAFERHVAIQDRQVVEKSLETINRVTRGEGPRRVVVALASDGAAREIDLAEAPDLHIVRQDLVGLIGRLREIGFRGHF
jgi:hypothetical protein